MTSKELHEQKIIPLRMELQRLEDEWKRLFRKEHGELIGAQASCGNCAYSCVQCTSDHNECMGSRCTCCNDWCVRWHPENKVSAFLRKYYHNDSLKFRNLQKLFGDDFIEDCDDEKKADLVMKMLTLMAEFDDKHNDEGWQDEDLD